jgi:uncharacterized DUF497 family protein
MHYFSVFWDLDEDPTGNVQHIAENDLTKEDVEGVLANSSAEGKSRSSGRAAAWGYTADGRYIIVIYDEIDEDTIRPVTAYEVEEP